MSCLNLCFYSIVDLPLFLGLLLRCSMYVCRAVNFGLCFWYLNELPYTEILLQPPVPHWAFGVRRQYFSIVNFWKKKEASLIYSLVKWSFGFWYWYSNVPIARWNLPSSDIRKALSLITTLVFSLFYTIIFFASTGWSFPPTRALCVGILTTMISFHAMNEAISMANRTLHFITSHSGATSKRQKPCSCTRTIISRTLKDTGGQITEHHRQFPQRYDSKL